MNGLLAHVLRLPGQAVGLLGNFAPRLLGADPSVQDPSFDPRMAQRNALFNAGTAITQATGGGSTLSPFAAIMSGLGVGRQSYQEAQEGARRTQEARAAAEPFMQPGGPSTTDLWSALGRSMVQGDHQMAGVLQNAIESQTRPGATPRWSTATVNGQLWAFNTQTGEGHRITQAEATGVGQIPMELRDQAWNAIREFRAEPDNKALIEVGRNYTSLERQLDLINRGNAASAAGAINQLVRLFDPNSVVREGEAARFGNAPYSLFDRLNQDVTRLLRGGYNQNIVEQIRASARELARVYRQIWTERQGETQLRWSTIYQQGELPLGNNPIPEVPGGGTPTPQPTGRPRAQGW